MHLNWLSLKPTFPRQPNSEKKKYASSPEPKTVLTLSNSIFEKSFLIAPRVVIRVMSHKLFK